MSKNLRLSDSFSVEPIRRREALQCRSTSRPQYSTLVVGWRYRPGRLQVLAVEWRVTDGLPFPVLARPSTRRQSHGRPMHLLVEKRFNCCWFFSCGSSHREEFSFRLSHFQPGEMGAAQSWATRPSPFCWRRKRRRRRAPIIPTNLTPLCSQEGSRHQQICQLFFHIFFFSLTVWLIVFLFFSQKIGVDFIDTLYQNGLCWLRLCKDRFGPVYSQGHGPLFRSPMKSAKNGSEWRRPVVVQDDWYFRLFKYL